MSETKHIPVLIVEAIDGLHLTKGDTAVDATLGGGGHTKEMLSRVLPMGRLVSFDLDHEAILRFREQAFLDVELKGALASGKLVLVERNYSALTETLSEHGIESVQAILADLGFSSDQIEAPERGFSFRESGPLDMRLGTASALTATEIVNTWSEAELGRIFRDYGDEAEWKRIARAIVRSRAEEPLATTGDLAALVAEAYPAAKRRKSAIHPATKTFQALRIAVNREFEHLERFLEQAVAALSPGGRLAVISFHSGEDRIVKQAFRTMATGCECPPNFPVCVCGKKPRLKIITKNPVIAGEAELKTNPRARSAKLRIVEKI